MSTTTYMIVDGHGHSLGGASTSEDEVKSMAQRAANGRGSSVWYVADDGLDEVEVAPEIDAEILAACDSDFAGRAGGAWQWEANGFTADEVREWLDRRVFEADAADTLRTLGVTPGDLDDLTPEDVGSPDYPDSVGYGVANGDISAADVADAIKARAG